MNDYGWAWHVHHEVLLEPLTEPIENRIAYIKAEKPAHEIELRLHLLKPVKGSVPKVLLDAWKAYVDAWKAYVDAQKAYWNMGKAYEDAGKAYEDAGKAYEDAGKAYDDAQKAYWNMGKACVDELNALHALECPNCPWNGKTIFP